MSRPPEDPGTPSLDFGLGKPRMALGLLALSLQVAQASIIENTWGSQEIFARLLIQNHPCVLFFFRLNFIYLGLLWSLRW